MTSYTVTRRHGCTIVTGTMPLDDMGRLLSNQEESQVIDPGLARRIGATLVVGTRQDLDAMAARRDLPLDPAIEADIRRAKAAGLPNEAVNWLEFGERGTSSDTLFSAGFGVPVMQSGVQYGHPLDTTDFARCRRLLEAVSDFFKRLPEVAKASSTWASLVEHWDALSDVMDEQAPDWRQAPTDTPRTIEMLRKLIA